MALVSGTIRNLFGGVSQSPPEQRNASQFQELVNMYPRDNERLCRRPPIQHRSKLTSTNLSGAFVHELGDYTVVIAGGVVRIYETATGTAQTVVNNVSWGYLNTASALKGVTVGDTAIIVNTGVASAKAPAVTASAPNRAHVTVLAGDYETTYSVTIAGLTYSYTTPAASAAGAKAATTTTAIAASLQSAIAGAAGMLLTRYGSTIYLRRSDAADFTISVTDGLADTGLRLVKKTVLQYSDLPARSEAGTIVQVLGEQTTGTDNYFVKSVASDGISLMADTWVETPAPESQYVVDSTTMPVQIVKTGASTFTVDACPWAERASGDDSTNPYPSFVGNAVSDLFVYEGRLGFIAKNNVCLSRSADYYNLFRETVTQILASDPIDVSGSISGITRLDWAVLWNEGLYLFDGGKAQYVLIGGRDGLTSSSISLKKVSEYHYDATVRPLVAGSRMFFVSTEGGSPHVMNYHTRGYDRIHEATDTGHHVPTYLSGTPLFLVADDARGLLLFQTSAGLYVYNYRYDNDAALVQGAWGRWTFGPTSVLGVSVRTGVLLFITVYSDGTYLNSMTLDRQMFSLATDGTTTFPAGTLGEEAYLDRLLWLVGGSVTSSWDGTYTTFTLPYAVAVDGSEGDVGLTLLDGRQLQAVSRPTPTTVRVLGNYVGTAGNVGVRYYSQAYLSTLYVRSADTGSADLRGRLHLRWLRIQYTTAQKISVIVSSTGRSTRTTTFSSPYPKAGELLVPIMLRNVDTNILIQMDSAAADGITALSWEGTYHPRAARI